MTAETKAAPAEASLSATAEAVEVDDYLRYKKLEKQLEHLDVMEEYVKLETRNLEKELLHAQEEVRSLFYILQPRFLLIACKERL